MGHEILFWPMGRAGPGRAWLVMGRAGPGPPKFGPWSALHEGRKDQRQEALQKVAEEREKEVRANQDSEKKILADMLTTEYGSKTTAFYGKEEIFSNFYPCEWEVEGMEAGGDVADLLNKIALNIL